MRREIGRAGLTRRQALQLGAAVSLASWQATDAAAAMRSLPERDCRERSFDEDWLFFRGDPSEAQAGGFDDSGWRPLDLPHDWSIEDLPYAGSQDGAATTDPSNLKVRPSDSSAPQVIGPFDKQNSPGAANTGWTVGGVGWYRKHFKLPRTVSADAHYELRFDGVYRNADVWLNGEHLGFHPYGYTSFAYDLTPYLNRHGDNVLAVRVDNTGNNSRWYSGSGIYRHTWLTVTGSVRIPMWGVQVTTPVVAPGRSSASVSVSVSNLGDRASQPQVRLTVLDPLGRQVAERTSTPLAVPAGETANCQLDVAVAPAALWSPESPRLYRAQTDVLVRGRVVDSVATTFGIRSLVWNGTDGFVLNGRQVKINGACIHHDNGPMGAVALDRSEERRIEILLAAGFNAIRTAHNPPSPALLDACDRLGMLVMDEFVDMWDTAKLPQDYSVYFPTWWQRDLTSMVLRDRNHPSIVIWSLGNEITEDSQYPARGQQMADLLRSLDRTRPLTVCIGAGTAKGAADPATAYEDVLDGHYELNCAGFQTMHDAHPDRAVTQSESWPASIYDDWKFAQDNAWMVGNWTWTGMDYLGESGIGVTPVGASGPTCGPGYLTYLTSHSGIGYPWFQANCGDIDLIGQRKPQNFWRMAVQGLSPVEMLVERPVPSGPAQQTAAWGYYDELESWTWEAPGQPLTVHVYTPGDSVALLLNGSAIATATPQRCVATFTVPYAAGELTAIASRAGREIGRKTLVTAGAPAGIRLASDLERLSTDRDDLAHVLVEIIDRHGNRVPDEVREVAFAVRGAGELAAVGNANPHNLDSFRQPQRFTYHGQALAILRPAKTPGVLTLTATADGLRPATLRLAVIGRQALGTPVHAGFSTAPLLLITGVAAAFTRRRTEHMLP